MSVSIEDFFGGGQGDFAMVADRTLVAGHGRVQTLEADSAGLKVVLPDARLLELGGPRFYVLNAGATNAFAIEDADGNVIVASLATSKGAILGLSKNDTLAGKWLADVRDLT